MKQYASHYNGIRLKRLAHLKYKWWKIQLILLCQLVRTFLKTIYIKLVKQGLKPFFWRYGGGLEFKHKTQLTVQLSWAYFAQPWTFRWLIKILVFRGVFCCSKFIRGLLKFCPHIHVFLIKSFIAPWFVSFLFKETLVIIKASEMLVAPRISEYFDLL